MPIESLHILAPIFWKERNSLDEQVQSVVKKKIKSNQINRSLLLDRANIYVKDMCFALAEDGKKKKKKIPGHHQTTNDSRNH